MDKAHLQTDQILDLTMAELEALYGVASRDLRKKIKPILEQMHLDDEEATQMERLKHAEKNGNLEKVALLFVAAMILANERAISKINDMTAKIYVINYDYMGKVIENKAKKDLGFTKFGSTAKAEKLLDRVRNYYDQRAYDRLVDRGILTKNITKAIKDGIKKGESIPKISKRIQSVSNKSKNSSILTARTETTRVESIARDKLYGDAKSKGIKIMKRWVATADSRTRDSHAALDGETIDTNKTFSNGGMYPGDANLPPEERINCRCATVPEVIN